MNGTWTRDSDGQPNRKGMTLIEVLIILSAIAIVVLISVPGSTMVLEHYRLKSASSDLLSSLNIAREEAIKRASTVRVCPSSNGRFCRSDGNWDQGWLVYTDGNADGTVQEIELIKAFPAPSEHIHIVAGGAVEQTASFTVSGLTDHNKYAAGEFHICHDGTESRAKTIQIDSDGWVQAFPIEKGSAACKRS
ncbi:MAG: GspH/FimT family pseudopilin [Xanthomonadales bacterium]